MDGYRTPAMPPHAETAGLCNLFVVLCGPLVEDSGSAPEGPTEGLSWALLFCEKLALPSGSQRGAEEDMRVFCPNDCATGGIWPRHNDILFLGHNVCETGGIWP